MIGSINLGAVDNLRATTTTLTNSGDQGEIDWVNSVLGTDFVVADLTKTEKDDGDWNWQSTDTQNVYAFNFGALQPPIQPEYFYIKTGNLTPGKGQTPTQLWALYDNIESYDWAVINLQQVGGYSILEIGKLSHLGSLGSQPVPEPSTLLLLGSGLLGLVGARKLRKRANL